MLKEFQWLGIYYENAIGQRLVIHKESLREVDVFLNMDLCRFLVLN